MKTALPRSKRVELTVSVAERLIRDPRPAFILIPRLDQDSADASVVDIGILHLREAAMYRILECLRRLSARGEAKLHKRKISFQIAAAASVPVSASALRQHLETCIGPDMGAYAAAKERELKTLGFDTHPVKANITFAPTTPEVLARRSIDGLPIEGSNVVFAHERFGLELPGIPGMPSSLFRGSALVRIEPQGRPCELVIKSAGAEDHVTVPGELIVPPFPRLPDPAQIYRVRTTLVDLTLGKDRLDLRLREETLDRSWPLDVWADSCRLIAQLVRGPSIIKVSIGDAVARFDTDRGIAEEGFDREHWQARARHFSKLLRIVRAVPGCPMPAGRYEDFVRLTDRLVSLAQSTVLATGELTGLQFNTNHDIPAADLDNSSFLIFSRLDIADVSIGIAQRAVVAVKPLGSDLTWTSLGAIDFLVAEPLLGEPQVAYDAFMQRTMRISGIDRSIDPGFYAVLPDLDRAA